MTIAKALTIEEAEGTVIKLQNVPAEGATARIPEPFEPTLGGSITIYISDLPVVKHDIGESFVGLYKVPKPALLNHLGLNRKFHYMLEDGLGMIDLSEPVFYDIQLA